MKALDGKICTALAHLRLSRCAYGRGLRVCLNVVVLNSFSHGFWQIQWSNHSVSFGKSCWWVLFGLRPLYCVWFAVFRFDETQIWLGDLRVVFSCLFVFFVLVRCDLPALLGLLGPCANSFLAAYTHVRTEPQCDIGQTRGKKKTASNTRFFHIMFCERTTRI